MAWQLLNTSKFTAPSSSSLMIKSSFIGAVVLHIIHYSNTFQYQLLILDHYSERLMTSTLLPETSLPRLFASRRHLVVDYYTYIYQLQLHSKYNNPSSSHLPRTSCCDCSQPGDIWWWTRWVRLFIPSRLRGSWAEGERILCQSTFRA